MGYIIPVQPIQSQIYANRMSMYEEYTAGSIMTTEYVAIPESSTCRSVVSLCIM